MTTPLQRERRERRLSAQAAAVDRQRAEAEQRRLDEEAAREARIAERSQRGAGLSMDEIVARNRQARQASAANYRAPQPDTGLTPEEVASFGEWESPRSQQDGELQFAGMADPDAERDRLTQFIANMMEAMEDSPEASTPAGRAAAGDAVSRAFSNVQADLRATMGGLNERRQEMARQMDEKISEAQERYESMARDVQSREGREALIQGVAKAAAGLFGLATGLDMSGVEFSQRDWQREYDRLLKRHEGDLGRIERGSDREAREVDRAEDRALSTAAMEQREIEQQARRQLDERRQDFAEEAKAMDVVLAQAGLQQREDQFNYKMGLATRDAEQKEAEAQQQRIKQRYSKFLDEWHKIENSRGSSVLKRRQLAARLMAEGFSQEEAENIALRSERGRAGGVLSYVQNHIVEDETGNNPLDQTVPVPLTDGRTIEMTMREYLHLRESN